MSGYIEGPERDPQTIVGWFAQSKFGSNGCSAPVAISISAIQYETSSDWYSLRHHGQIVQCVAAIQTQPGDQVESLQLTCPVCSPVWM